MRRVWSLVIILLLLGFAGAPESPAGAPDVEFRIIVHPEVSGTHVPREDLSSIFLRDEMVWADGQPVAPVDQSLRSAVRAAFSEHVLGEGMDTIEALWARKIIKGVTPPMVKTSDDEVISYVARTPGAIGYVSTDTRLPSTVRILSILY